MPFESIADLILSYEPKRHIKSKKKRIRKKYEYKNFWLKKKKEQENEKQV